MKDVIVIARSEATWQSQACDLIILYGLFLILLLRLPRLPIISGWSRNDVLVSLYPEQRITYNYCNSMQKREEFKR